MAGMNSQIHLKLDTYRHQKLREEAEKLDMSVNELIRSKLENPPVPEEILLIRRLKRILTKK
jgi:hypothetical protein